MPPGDRTTISLRLSTADVQLLEGLRDKAYGGEAGIAYRGYSYGRSSRSKVLRQALRDAAEKAGVA